MKYFDEAHIKGVLEMHPSECVFELDAPKNITARLSSKTKEAWIESAYAGHAEFKECWSASEIFCPHEGIDRLVECGVKSLDWELNYDRCFVSTSVYDGK